MVRTIVVVRFAICCLYYCVKLYLMEAQKGVQRACPLPGGLGAAFPLG